LASEAKVRDTAPAPLAKARSVDRGSISNMGVIVAGLDIALATGAALRTLDRWRVAATY